MLAIDGLVSWYRAEGNPNDSAGGNNGAFVGGATTTNIDPLRGTASGNWTVLQGKVGQAFYFNESPTHVAIPNSPSLALQTFTIDAWVKPNYFGSVADATGAEIVGKNLPGVSSATSVSILGPGSTGRFTFAISLSNGSQPFFSSAIGFALDVWHHVAMTWDGTFLRGYVDGQPQGAGEVGPGLISYDPTTPWTIGGHVGAGPSLANRHYEGKIDEVGFYNRAFTLPEVQSLHTNNAPTANNDVGSVNEDQVLSVPVLANDVDPEAVAMTAVLVAGPSHGSVTLNADGSYSYTPVANYNGADSFQYKASDGVRLSNVATVNLTVIPVADAPVLAPIGNRSVVEGSLLTFTATATDADMGDTLTFSLQGAPAGAAIHPQTGVFTWTPTAEQGPGTFNVDVTVSDGTPSAPDVETIAITVTEPPSNQSPVVTGLALDDASIDENGSVVLSGLVTDADSADTHTVTIDWGDGSAPQVIPVNPTTRAFNAAHPYLDDNPTSTPSDNYLIQARAEDNQGAVSPVVTIGLVLNNVAPAVDPITGPSFGVQGQSLAFTGSYSDVGTADTQTASWLVIDGSSAVVASGSGTSFSFTPLAVDTYTVQFSVTDDDGGTTAVSKSVNVASVQMLPDPDRPGMTMLVIGGTAVSDTITLTPTAITGEYSLNLNGLILGPYAPTGCVQIYGGGGSDSIVLNGNSSVNAFEVHDGWLVLNSLPFFDHDIENRQINALGSGDTIAAYDGSVTIDGGSASDILVAAGPGSHAWLITAQNAGSLDGQIFFTQVEQLVGGSDADTFQLVGSARVSGSLKGGGGSDVLIAADSDNTWVIGSANAGTVKNTSFSGFETLRGGSGADTFRIVQGVTFAGSLDGADGADELNYSAYTSAVEVNLDLGTATGVSGVIGIENTTGGNGNDFLVGSAAANNISGGNGEDIILGWSGIDTLSGNSGSDLVVGGSGGDTLHGNNMDDILVGGKLAYADEVKTIDRGALEAILAIWRTPISYSTRTATLRGGLLNSSAVLDDYAVDKLYGDAGVDWFLIGIGDEVKPGKGEDTN